MSLKGGELICLDQNGQALPNVVKAKERKLTIGSYMSCDFIILHEDVERVHCEIKSDAYGHITIHNLSETHPVILNGEVMGIKRTLLSGSTIEIVGKKFSWRYKNPAVNVNESRKAPDTPISQIGIPEQPPTSCPNLKDHCEQNNRFTVHNFGYRINFDEEDNVSLGFAATVNSAQRIGENDLKEISIKETKLCEDFLKTPDNQSKGNNKITIINSTENKKTCSTETKKCISQWRLSDIVITSYSPRETGVRIEKTFAEIRPLKTPRSVYNTPVCMHSSTHDTLMTNSTPAATSINSCGSMCLIDLTTPTKLRPVCSHPVTPLRIRKELIEKSGKRIVNKSEKNLLSSTPSSTKLTKIVETPSSSSCSAISVDSSSCTGVSNTSNDNSILSGVGEKFKAKKNIVKSTLMSTPLRTPQTLMKRALLTSAKKQVNLVATPAVTPIRNPSKMQSTFSKPSTSAASGAVTLLLQKTKPESLASSCEKVLTQCNRSPSDVVEDSAYKLLNVFEKANLEKVGKNEKNILMTAKAKRDSTFEIENHGNENDIRNKGGNNQQLVELESQLTSIDVKELVNENSKNNTNNSTDQEKILEIIVHLEDHEGFGECIVPFADVDAVKHERQINQNDISDKNASLGSTEEIMQQLNSILQMPKLKKINHLYEKIDGTQIFDVDGNEMTAVSTPSSLKFDVSGKGKEKLENESEKLIAASFSSSKLTEIKNVKIPIKSCIYEKMILPSQGVQSVDALPVNDDDRNYKHCSSSNRSRRQISPTPDITNSVTNVLKDISLAENTSLILDKGVIIQESNIDSCVDSDFSDSMKETTEVAKNMEKDQETKAFIRRRVSTSSNDDIPALTSADSQHAASLDQQSIVNRKRRISECEQQKHFKEVTETKKEEEDIFPCSNVLTAWDYSAGNEEQYEKSVVFLEEKPKSPSTDSKQYCSSTIPDILHESLPLEQKVTNSNLIVEPCVTTVTNNKIYQPACTVSKRHCSLPTPNVVTPSCITKRCASLVAEQEIRKSSPIQIRDSFVNEEVCKVPTVCNKRRCSFSLSNAATPERIMTRRTSLTSENKYRYSKTTVQVSTAIKHTNESTCTEENVTNTIPVSIRNSRITETNKTKYQAFSESSHFDMEDNFIPEAPQTLPKNKILHEKTIAAHAEVDEQKEIEYSNNNYDKNNAKELLIMPLLHKSNQHIEEDDLVDSVYQTPRAKNLMIPNVPSSAVLHKTLDSVELLQKTEYDLNITNEIPNLEDMFKTPLAARHFRAEEDDGMSTTELKTQLQKAIHSPFTSSDVLSDLPKVEPDNLTVCLEETINENAAQGSDVSNSNNGCEIAYEEYYKTVEFVKDPLSASVSKNHGNKLDRKTNIDNHNLTVESDRLDSSVQKSMPTSLKKGTDKNKRFSEKDFIVKEAVSTSAADMSGIELLDETTDSLFSDALVLSSDSEMECEKAANTEYKHLETFEPNLKIASEDEFSNTVAPQPKMVALTIIESNADDAYDAPLVDESFGECVNILIEKDVLPTVSIAFEYNMHISEGEGFGESVAVDDNNELCPTANIFKTLVEKKLGEHNTIDCVDKSKDTKIGNENSMPVITLNQLRDFENKQKDEKECVLEEIVVHNQKDINTSNYAEEDGIPAALQSADVESVVNRKSKQEFAKVNMSEAKEDIPDYKTTSNTLKDLDKSRIKQKNQGKCLLREKQMPENPAASTMIIFDEQIKEITQESVKIEPNSNEKSGTLTISEVGKGSISEELNLKEKDYVIQNRKTDHNHECSTLDAKICEIDISHQSDKKVSHKCTTQSFDFFVKNSTPDSKYLVETDAALMTSTIQDSNIACKFSEKNEVIPDTQNSNKITVTNVSEYAISLAKTITQGDLENSAKTSKYVCKHSELINDNEINDSSAIMQSTSAADNKTMDSEKYQKMSLKASSENIMNKCNVKPAKQSVIYHRIDDNENKRLAERKIVYKTKKISDASASTKKTHKVVNIGSEFIATNTQAAVEEIGDECIKQKCIGGSESTKKPEKDFSHANEDNRDEIIENCIEKHMDFGKRTEKSLVDNEFESSVTLKKTDKETKSAFEIKKELCKASVEDPIAIQKNQPAKNLGKFGVPTGNCQTQCRSEAEIISPALNDQYKEQTKPVSELEDHLGQYTESKEKETEIKEFLYKSEEDQRSKPFQIAKANQVFVSTLPNDIDKITKGGNVSTLEIHVISKRQTAEQNVPENVVPEKKVESSINSIETLNVVSNLPSDPKLEDNLLKIVSISKYDNADDIRPCKMQTEETGYETSKFSGMGELIQTAKTPRFFGINALLKMTVEEKDDSVKGASDMLNTTINTEKSGEETNNVKTSPFDTRKLKGMGAILHISKSSIEASQSGDVKVLLETQNEKVAENFSCTGDSLSIAQVNEKKAVFRTELSNSDLAKLPGVSQLLQTTESTTSNPKLFTTSSEENTKSFVKTPLAAGSPKECEQKGENEIRYDIEENCFSNTALQTLKFLGIRETRLKSKPQFPSMKEFLMAPVKKDRDESTDHIRDLVETTQKPVKYTTHSCGSTKELQQNVQAESTSTQEKLFVNKPTGDKFFIENLVGVCHKAKFSESRNFLNEQEESNCQKLKKLDEHESEIPTWSEARTTLNSVDNNEEFKKNEKGTVSDRNEKTSNIVPADSSLRPGRSTSDDDTASSFSGKYDIKNIESVDNIDGESHMFLESCQQQGVKETTADGKFEKPKESRKATEDPDSEITTVSIENLGSARHSKTSDVEFKIPLKIANLQEVKSLPEVGKNVKPNCDQNTGLMCKSEMYSNPLVNVMDTLSLETATEPINLKVNTFDMLTSDSVNIRRLSMNSVRLAVSEIHQTSAIDAVKKTEKSEVLTEDERIIKLKQAVEADSSEDTNITKRYEDIGRNSKNNEHAQICQIVVPCNDVGCMVEYQTDKNELVTMTKPESTENCKTNYEKPILNEAKVLLQHQQVRKRGRKATVNELPIQDFVQKAIIEDPINIVENRTSNGRKASQKSAIVSIDQPQVLRATRTAARRGHLDERPYEISNLVTISALSKMEKILVTTSQQKPAMEDDKISNEGGVSGKEMTNNTKPLRNLKSVAQRAHRGKRLNQNTDQQRLDCNPQRNTHQDDLKEVIKSDEHEIVKVIETSMASMVDVSDVEVLPDRKRLAKTSKARKSPTKASQRVCRRTRKEHCAEENTGENEEQQKSDRELTTLKPDVVKDTYADNVESVYVDELPKNPNTGRILKKSIQSGQRGKRFKQVVADGDLKLDQAIGINGPIHKCGIREDFSIIESNSRSELLKSAVQQTQLDKRPSENTDRYIREVGLKPVAQQPELKDASNKDDSKINGMPGNTSKDADQIEKEVSKVNPVKATSKSNSTKTWQPDQHGKNEHQDLEKEGSKSQQRQSVTIEQKEVKKATEECYGKLETVGDAVNQSSLHDHHTDDSARDTSLTNKNRKRKNVDVIISTPSRDHPRRGVAVHNYDESSDTESTTLKLSTTTSRSGRVRKPTAKALERLHSSSVNRSPRTVIGNKKQLKGRKLSDLSDCVLEEKIHNEQEDSIINPKMPQTSILTNNLKNTSEIKEQDTPKAKRRGRRKLAIIDELNSEDVPTITVKTIDAKGIREISEKSPNEKAKPKQTIRGQYKKKENKIDSGTTNRAQRLRVRPADNLKDVDRQTADTKSTVKRKTPSRARGGKVHSAAKKAEDIKNINNIGAEQEVIKSTVKRSVKQNRKVAATSVAMETNNDIQTSTSGQMKATATTTRLRGRNVRKYSAADDGVDTDEPVAKKIALIAETVVHEILPAEQCKPVRRGTKPTELTIEAESQTPQTAMVGRGKRKIVHFNEAADTIKFMTPITSALGHPEAAEVEIDLPKKRTRRAKK